MKLNVVRKKLPACGNWAGNRWRFLPYPRWKSFYGENTGTHNAGGGRKDQRSGSTAADPKIKMKKMH